MQHFSFTCWLPYAPQTTGFICATHTILLLYSTAATRRHRQTRTVKYALGQVLPPGEGTMLFTTSSRVLLNQGKPFCHVPACRLMGVHVLTPMYVMYLWFGFVVFRRWSLCWPLFFFIFFFTFSPHPRCFGIIYSATFPMNGTPSKTRF